MCYRVRYYLSLSLSLPYSLSLWVELFYFVKLIKTSLGKIYGLVMRCLPEMLENHMQVWSLNEAQ